MKNIIKVFVLLSAIAFSIPQTYSQVLVSASLSIRVAPPMLRVYSQPQCPVDGYLWSPGYWAYDSGGYYWVDGEWVLPPAEGLLWTPGYWSFSGGYYGWQQGYWGSQVGFYGGVNYGYGYGGKGYNGGKWQGGHFRYNTAVANVNRAVIHNTYVNRTGVSNSGRNNNRRSFNGPGGITARPSAQQQTARNEKHLQPTSQQSSHVRTERTVPKSNSSLTEKSHATFAKKSTPESHATQRTATTHAVHNTTYKHSNKPANMHSSAPRQTREMNKTLQTNHRNTRSVGQSHTTQSRSPHVQQQHSMHAPAGRQEGGGKKAGGDKHN
ncbi:MAG TPA: YXWGXW repeat-containing protein [Hanamia sp.]